MTPQPAGHSRHTVANHAATPGTICSFGTTRGRMVSVARWQPLAAAVAPLAATTRKKSRRFIIYRSSSSRQGAGGESQARPAPSARQSAGGESQARPAPSARQSAGGESQARPAPSARQSAGGESQARPAPSARGCECEARLAPLCSMVARDAVERRVCVRRRVLPPVAVEAPAHRERRRGRPEPHEVQQVVRQARAGHGAERRHRSEEHTSELQSLAYLVCRLLLEKKKNMYRKRGMATTGGVGSRATREAS